MKKLLAIAIVLMMVPFTAFAMETISDSDMDSVTGQAGVSIAVDHVQIYQKIDGISYTDTDGMGVTGAAGTIGVGTIEQLITINAIGGSIDEVGTAARYGVTADVTPHALTIDVATVGELLAINSATGGAAGLTAGGAAAMGADSTVIVIGLPTCEITVSEFTLTPYLTDGTNTQEFGTITIGAQTIAILSGELLIAAH